MEKLLLTAYAAENSSVNRTELIGIIEGVKLSLEVLAEENDLRTYYYDYIINWIGELTNVIKYLKDRSAMDEPGNPPVYSCRTIFELFSEQNISPFNPITNIVRKLIRNKLEENTIPFPKEKS